MPSTGLHALRRPRHPSLVAFIISLQRPLLCLAAGDYRGVRGGAAPSRQGQSDGVYFVTEVAGELSASSAARQQAAEHFHDAEQARLQAAIQKAASQLDKSVLEGAAVTTEEARLASQSAYSALLNFATTLKQAMGSREDVASCQLLTCGEHAYCDGVQDRARCRCLEGYEGNGFVCRPPSHPVEHALFQYKQGAAPPRVADLHVSTLKGNRVALVYRDVSDQNRGYLMLGQAGRTDVRWNTPILFSNHSQAFSPVLVELQEGNGLAIAFRDANRGGSGILVGGKYDPQKNLVELGPLRAFARHQAQGMSMVALPKSLVAIVFAEHTPDRATGSLERGAMYGSALLARVRTDGAGAEVVSKRRFASGPVARISAAMVSPTSFLLAFRQAEDTTGGERAEASCAIAQLHAGELVFDPRALSLEPEQGQIWARSVAPLGSGLVAYTYHSGGEQLTKQALLQIDPETQQLSLLRSPTVIGKGFTPYVGSVSTSTPLAQHQAPEQARRLQDQGHRIFTYFSSAGSTKPKAQFCKVAGDGLSDHCKEFTWANREVTSIAGTQVGDGRLILLLSDARQVAYYQLVGVMDPL